MANKGNIGLVTLSQNWQKLEDLIAEQKIAGFSFPVGQSYYIQYRGNSDAYFVELENGEPTEETEGFMLPQNGKPWEYIPESGVTLYVRSITSGVVNIAIKREGGDTPSEDTEIIAVLNNTGYPITAGELVRFREEWNSETQTTDTVAVNGGYLRVDDTFRTGRALADIANGETGNVMIVSTELYFAQITFNVTPSNANVNSEYFDRYTGYTTSTEGSFLAVPYYTNVNSKISLEGYKPQTINLNVEDSDITQTVELESAEPVLLISIPNTFNYYYSKDLDNITLTSGALPDTMTNPIVGDGRYLYAGSSATNSTDMFYSTDAVNWTTISAGDDITNPTFYNCNDEVYLDSSNLGWFYLMQSPTQRSRIGGKNAAADTLISGGYDGFEFQFVNSSDKVFAGYEAFPDVELPQTFTTDTFSNIVEKWQKGWIADDLGSNEAHLYSLSDIDQGFNTVVDSALLDNNSSRPFIVDCDTSLAVFFNKGTELSNTLWLVNEQGTVTKKSYPTGTTNCWGAAYYEGTIIALFKVNGTNCLYKSTDLGDTWTLISSTSIADASSVSYGNLMTIGYI